MDEIEALIAEHVMDGITGLYSSDMDAAWRIVERMQWMGWGVEIGNMWNSKRYGVQFNSMYDSALEFAASAPLAICLAALSALNVATNVATNVAPPTPTTNAAPSNAESEQ